MKHLLLTLLLCAAVPALAQTKAPAKKPAAPAGPKPTMANVPYGTHERQVMDFYKAESDKPTPLVFYIHGGGWMGGDKSKVSGVKDYLAAGISVTSINYRFVSMAQEAGVEPPVKWPLEDAARALQFVRSKAGEWNIDPTRIGATGGSAGGASTCWLCTHDDMADPKSNDPISRQSTRLLCGAPVGAQTCFDPHLLREWLPNMSYGGHAFGFRKDGLSRQEEFQAFYDGRDKVMPWVLEYSAYHLVTPDDSPIFMQYGGDAKEPPAKGQSPKDPTHSAVLGLLLQTKLKEAGVENYIVYPGSPEAPWKSATGFLIDRLKGE